MIRRVNDEEGIKVRVFLFGNIQGWEKKTDELRAVPLMIGRYGEGLKKQKKTTLSTNNNYFDRCPPILFLYQPLSQPILIILIRPSSPKLKYLATPPPNFNSLTAR